MAPISELAVKKKSDKQIMIIDNGGEQLWTTSLDLAEKFGKRHDRLMQTIRDLECPDGFSLHNFVESEWTNERGKTYPCYFLTRDGFTLLAMGFTGKKAIARC